MLQISTQFFVRHLPVLSWSRYGIFKSRIRRNFVLPHVVLADTNQVRLKKKKTETCKQNLPITKRPFHWVFQFARAGIISHCKVLPSCEIQSRCSQKGLSSNLAQAKVREPTRKAKSGTISWNCLPYAVFSEFRALCEEFRRHYKERSKRRHWQRKSKLAKSYQNNNKNAFYSYSSRS